MDLYQEYPALGHENWSIWKRTLVSAVSSGYETPEQVAVSLKHEPPEERRRAPEERLPPAANPALGLPPQEEEGPPAWGGRAGAADPHCADAWLASGLLHRVDDFPASPPILGYAAPENRRQFRRPPQPSPSLASLPAYLYRLLPSFFGPMHPDAVLWRVGP